MRSWSRLLRLTGFIAMAASGALLRCGTSQTPVESACRAAPTLRVLSPGSKICQLVGDYDPALGEPAPNLTATRFRLSNTDLGASFEHHGRLWFLFGDSFPSGQSTDNPVCGDAVASTTDLVADTCVALDFISNPNGGFRSPAVPTIDLGCLDVPLHGLSDGSSMYVWFSTAHMSRSVLARSDDDARHFTLVGTLSDCQCATPTDCRNPSCHFVNVSASIVPEAQATGLPGSGDRVLLFGSGMYRKSNVYLAVTSLSKIEDFSAIRYFKGIDPTACKPMWSDREADATALFDTTHDNGNEQPCVGELSVYYDVALGRWLAMYNCRYTLAAARVATSPWGPWSTAAHLFEPQSAYCQYIFNPDGGCPQVADRPQGGKNGPGDTYGPYAVARYSKKTDQGAQVVFTMSTGNPYTVMLMKAELQSRP